MALFNDGAIATTENLRAYESSVLEMASTEGVDLTVKLDLAQRELGVEILRLLVEQTAEDTNPPTTHLSQIVVSEPLLQWHTMQTLMLSYRDAFHNQLNDRYEKKWKEYERQAGLKAALAFEVGMGIASIPVAQAAMALVDPAAGVLALGTYEIRITWQNASGSEGSPSDGVLFGSTGGQVPRVTHPDSVATNSRSWNVYVGPVNGALTRQNLMPLALGVPWTMPETGLINGMPIGSGQTPDYYLRQVRAFRRG